VTPARRADAAAVGALAVWALATAVATLVRPGELLELALVGAAGIAAWGVLARPNLTVRFRALAALAFFLPLVNTWPARSLVAKFDTGPVLVQAALAPSTLLLAALVLVAPARLPSRAALPYAVAGGVLVAAAAIASALSDDPAEALRGTLHVYALPLAAGLAVAASVRRAREGWTLVHVLALAAAVPALVGAAAYVLSFGVPLSVTDLVAAKIALVRPFLFQELTFGNVGHLADLALLLLPAAVLGSARRRAPAWLRTASGAAAAALVLALVLTASRGAMAVGAVQLLGATVLLSRSRSRALLVPAAGLAILAVVMLSPAMRGSYGTLVPSVDTRAPAAAPEVEPEEVEERTTTVEVGSVDVTVTDTSAADRVDAVRTGLELARDNLPFSTASRASRWADASSVPVNPTAVTSSADSDSNTVTATTLQPARP
jgi:hypothetical protein